MRSFKALAQTDQHDVLVSLLRLPIEAEYSPPSEDELLRAAEQVFLTLDAFRSDDDHSVPEAWRV